MYRSHEWIAKLLPTQLEYHTLRGQTALVGGCRRLDFDCLVHKIMLGYPCLPSV